jgi:glycosyltransferase involved in cell wall biosynthesis
MISICIPAYKNIDYLKRLMDSIAAQTFKDFEVIISDDSPDDSIKKFLAEYQKFPRLVYHRNTVALGTPENWNEGIRKANGKWIKIMHDDDWFSNKESLALWAKAANLSGADFIFCAYNNVYLGKNSQHQVHPTRFRLDLMKEEPYTLFAKNIIGPPSVTMHRNNQNLFYDNKTKWVVDIDFYIRWLKELKVEYLDKVLINVGMSEEQVTVDCVNNRKVQVPENFYLLNKMGRKKLNNLIIYDAWWRLIRNLEITAIEHIKESGYDGEIPRNIVRMVGMQRLLPRKLLTVGVMSKICMFVHYLFRSKD